MANTQQGIAAELRFQGRKRLPLSGACTQSLGQQQGLIEAALSQAPAMQRHGNKSIAGADGLQRLRVLQHQLGKGECPARLRSKLESIYALLPGPGVGNSGVAAINPRKWLVQAVGAQIVGTWVAVRRRAMLCGCGLCIGIRIGCSLLKPRICILWACVVAMRCMPRGQQQCAPCAAWLCLCVGLPAHVANALSGPGMAQHALARQFP